MNSPLDKIQDILETIEYSGYDPVVDKSALNQALAECKKLRESIDQERLKNCLRISEKYKTSNNPVILGTAKALHEFVGGGDD